MSTHYIYMNGSIGCLPDNIGATESEDTAIESLSDLFELSDEQEQELRDSGILYFDDPGEMGADYCSIDSCDCDDIDEHNIDWF